MASSSATEFLSRFAPPLHGATNPGRTRATTPGSFANAPDIGGPLSYSSPDTPGMPAPSDKTAWDFLPGGWSVERWGDGAASTLAWMGRVPSGNPHVPDAEAAPANDGPRGTPSCSCCKGESHKKVEFTTSSGGAAPRELPA